MELMIFLIVFGGILLINFWPSSNKHDTTDSYQTPVSRPPPSGAKKFDAQNKVPTQTPASIVGPAYVVDGDTIVIKKTQIRLYGIDAPEMNHPFGQKSKWAMVALCKGSTIRAEITDMDVHGRTVAKCYLPDGRDLSAELVKQGLAIDWPKFSGGVYRSLEVEGARKKMWLADARQKGRLNVIEKFESQQKSKSSS